MTKTWQILSLIAAIIFSALGWIFFVDQPALADPSPGEGATFHVSEESIPAISPAVRDLPVQSSPPVLYREINPLRNPAQFMDGMGLKGSNTQIQDSLAPLNEVNTGTTPGLLFDFEGLGTDGYAPPDTVGDVGPNHYIQMVNISFAVFDKTGTMVDGPHPYNSLFTGFGGVCESNNDGDPIVLYDRLADRWMLIQFADIFGSKTMCIAVSTSPDPTHTFYLYAFNMPDVPDYMKFGVWPDGYYMGTNSGFPNAYYAHVFDRNSMLSGLPATAQSFGGYPNFLMPSDLDGATSPPAGSPNYFYTFLKDGYGNHPPGVDRIEVFEFDVDWATPANSTFTLADTIPIAGFNYTVCGFFVQTCIPQPGTSNTIDSLSYWPMWRAQYRNFIEHETIVGNFTVDLDGSDKAAIRWFELRNSPAGWTLFQEGTHAPDSDHRWMGSIAMDGSGNIALGYSVSGSSTIPSIRYATRQASDPPGTLQTEATLLAGSGVQTSIQRWGDYSAMVVDPADDCTFWYTTEYHDSNDGGFNWNTRVGVFKEPGCTGVLGPDFTLGADPVNQEVCIPGDAVYSISTTAFLGFSQPITMTLQGNPAGTTASFSGNPIAPGSGVTLTVGNTGAAAGGSYNLDIIGSTLTRTHTSTVGLDVYTGVPAAPTLTSPTDGQGDVSTLPVLSWSGVPQVSDYSLEIATDPAFTNIIYSAGVGGTSHTVSTKLDPFSLYYWRVSASNFCGEGAVSTAFSFITGSGSSILLVKDEGSPLNSQLGVYTGVLDGLGYAYDIWDTGTGNVEPSLADLQAYDAVIWYTAGLFGSFGSGPAGPSASTEADLSTWLDAGGCLFISSQDYYYDKGLTSLMTGYLGVSSLTNDNGNYVTVTGTNVFSGLGSYSLTYPFTDYSDPIAVGNGGVTAMLGNNGRVAAVTKDSGTYKTTFWAFPWEALPAGGRSDTMQAYFDWCGLSVVAGGVISGNALMQGRLTHPGIEVVVWQSGSPVMTDTTNISGNFFSLSVPSGSYTVTINTESYLEDNVGGVVVIGDAVTNLGSRVLLGGDINGDRVVDILDLVLIGSKFGLADTDPGFDPLMDINADGIINVQDLAIAAGNYGMATP